MPDNLLWIILGMSLITGMFRVLPPILVRYAEPPAVLLDVLSSMPYAILGAFLFPSVFSVGAEPWMGAVTVALVVVMALYRLPVVLVLTLAVAIMYGLQWLHLTFWS